MKRLFDMVEPKKGNRSESAESGHDERSPALPSLSDTAFELPHPDQDPLRSIDQSDRYGFELIERRIKAIPELFERYMESPLPDLQPLSGSVGVYGLGSSRSHAEYLATLLQRIPGVHASSQSVSSLHDQSGAGEVKIVFSQGMSTNTHGLIQSQIADERGILFTATTSEGAHNTRKAEVHSLLTDINSSGVDTVIMPMENEYQVLVRTVGPWFGFLAAYRVASQLAPKEFAPIRTEQIVEMFSEAPLKAKEILSQTSRETLASASIYLVGHTPAINHLRNIGYKFMEGAFLENPMVSTVMEFDHGPFQLVQRRGGSIFLFSSEDESEIDFNRSLTESLVAVGQAPPLVVCSTLKPELRVLEYEMVMNHVMLDLMKQGGNACNQLDFQEGENYNKNPTKR